MKLKIIGTYSENNIVLYEKKLLDGLLFALYSFTDDRIIDLVLKLRKQNPDVLIYLDNGAFPLFQFARPTHNIKQRYKNFNIVEHIERYLNLVKLIKPHWAPIPLDFIMLDRFRYTKEEIETSYTYTMKMNKRFSIKGCVPVAQISTRIPVERYISDFKECNMERLCIGGVATSGPVKQKLARFVNIIKNAFPNIKIHVFGRPSTWFPFLEFLGIYSVDTNNIGLWVWIKRTIENKKGLFSGSIYKLQPAILRQIITKDIVDKLRWLKDAESIDYTTTVVSSSY